ncbi:MAG TPA: hypothetical protein VNE40_03425 [Candidatus Dormibacteraeota bacterium]|nr:hypothetical protein [Candidatus Dormibacteraeota bacterium]
MESYKFADPSPQENESNEVSKHLGDVAAEIAGTIADSDSPEKRAELLETINLRLEAAGIVVLDTVNSDHRLGARSGRTRGQVLFDMAIRKSSRRSNLL